MPDFDDFLINLLKANKTDNYMLVHILYCKFYISGQNGQTFTNFCQKIFANEEYSEYLDV